MSSQINKQTFDVIVIHESDDTYTCIFEGESKVMEDSEIPNERTTGFKKQLPGVKIYYDIFYYINNDKNSNWIQINAEIDDETTQANIYEGDKIGDKVLSFKFVDMCNNKGQITY